MVTSDHHYILSVCYNAMQRYHCPYVTDNSDLGPNYNFNLVYSPSSFPPVLYLYRNKLASKFIILN